MANLRVIYNNVADTATLSASSEAGTLTAANLKDDRKSLVWRATGTSATLTLTWATAQITSGVALPFTNLTSAATIRVRGYVSVGDASPIFDTGTIPACAAPALGLWNWGAVPLGANAYAYAGGAYARAWIANPASVAKLVIDLVDTGNTAGYVEASRLVVGSYWEPTVGADYGAGMQPVDRSTQYRNDAGDLQTDTGTRHNMLRLPMSNLSPTDRTQLWNILRGNGKYRPLFVSLFPGDADTDLEQMYQVYGRFRETPAMSMPSFRIAAATAEIEEI